jgi:hypothetical protein
MTEFQMTQSQTQIHEQEAQRRAARVANLAAFGLAATVTTDEAADAINRKPQTLRKWACLENGPIRPVRINGRLAWRVVDLQALLSGDARLEAPASLARKSADFAERKPEPAIRTRRSPAKATPVELA